MFNVTFLDNGLSVLTTSMPSTRSVTVCAFVASGSRYETDELGGVAHFIEHMVFKGTRRWPTAKEVSEVVEGVGGVMNASTDKEMTILWVKVASIHFHRALELLADMLLYPIMDSEEIEKERQVVQEELNMTNDYPSYRAEQLLDQEIWPNQALGRDIGGTKASVMGLTRKDMLEFMSHQYVPSNATLSVAGDISNDEASKAASHVLSRWDSKHSPLSWYPVKDDNGSTAVRVEYRKTEQSHICLGLPGLARNHPDRYILDLLNVILGQGMSSRLFVDLRENQGLAYDVHSSVTYLRDSGALTVYCGVQPANSRRAIVSVLEQLERMKENIPQQEINKAREFVKGRLLLGMEDSLNVSMWMGAQQLLLGKVQEVESVVDRLNAVTNYDLRRVAEQIIDTTKVKLVVVGPHRGAASFERLLKG